MAVVPLANDVPGEDAVVAGKYVKNVVKRRIVRRRMEQT
jgi:hypothetical protein